MDLVAAILRGRPIQFAGLALFLAMGPARAAEPSSDGVIVAGSPVPLYLQTLQMTPGAIDEWANPVTSKLSKTPVINTPAFTTPNAQDQKQTTPGGNIPATPAGTSPEPATLVSALTGSLLAGLVAWRRRRRDTAASAEDEADIE